jgi:hypothetical protein
MGLSQERIVERYCHMHPKVDKDVLMEAVTYKSEHFMWAGKSASASSSFMLSINAFYANKSHLLQDAI